MSNKIPTAEEFFEQHIQRGVNNTHSEYINTAIKFAKLHVKSAIAECIESAPSGSSTDPVSYEDVVESLKDCYPETNIV
jgi:hypothetical protein